MQERGEVTRVVSGGAGIPRQVDPTPEPVCLITIRYCLAARPLLPFLS